MNLVTKGDERSLFHQAWKMWGERTQVLMLVEESSELAHAGCRYLRDGRTIVLLAEEIADTLLTIEQVVQELDMEKAVMLQRDRKLVRLQSLLAREQKERRPE